VILLRHGESTGNLAGVTQGQIDTPLSETGLRQALALAERWQAAGVCFDRILSSPLQRARQTAEVVASLLPAPIDLNPDWMERHYGLASGLTPEEVAQRFPLLPTFHPYMHLAETGESKIEIFLRAGRALQDLFDRGPGRYLVVSHGGLLNMAMYVILGIPPQMNFSGPRFTHDNTGYTTFDYVTSQACWRLRGFNDCAHLASLSGM
jgi:2,3-bisphosphoglycerate-dependent phosphoglycerate mutase